MTESKVNHLAVIVLSILHMALSAGWYGAFSEQWLGYVGLTEDEALSLSPIWYGVAFVGAIIFNYSLYTIMKALNVASIGKAITVGLWIWAAFYFFELASHYGFALKDFGLTLVDSGKTLVCWVLSAVILYVWQKK